MCAQPVSKRILLLSNSIQYGFGCLDHADEEIRQFLGGIRNVLLIPFAMRDRDVYALPLQFSAQKLFSLAAGTLFAY